MEKTTETTTSEPSGFAKWLGRIIAIVFMLLALAIGAGMLYGDHSSSNSPSTESTSPSQPSADDDALRRSLGGK